MKPEQARKFAEEIISQTEFLPLPAVHVIKSRSTAPDGDMYCLGYETTEMLSYAKRYAREAIAAALVKLTEGQEPAIPTEQQILDACEDAGLWPNTAASWVQNGAFRRYHEAINRMLYTPPIPSQQEDQRQVTAQEDSVLRRAAMRSAVVVHPGQQEERKPLTDDEIWRFWCCRPEVLEGEDDSMEAQFVAACRRAIDAALSKEGV